MRDWNKEKKEKEKGTTEWPERIAIRRGTHTKWKVLPVLFREPGTVEIYVRERGEEK